MVKKKFVLDKLIPSVKPIEETFIFADSDTKEDIEECFIDWVLEQVDAGIIDVEQPTMTKE